MNFRLCKTIALSMLSIVLAALAMPSRAASVDGVISLTGSKQGGSSVVWIDGGNAPAPSPEAHAMVDQRDKMFIPHITVVPVGTKVQFPNDDTIFHNVFAYFNAKKFDLGMYPRGVSKAVTFDKSGLVVLLCNVHSDMSAYIMVVDTPYYAVADRAGHYTIRNVSPGTYTLHAWNENGSTATQSITVAADGTSNVPVQLARK